MRTGKAIAQGAHASMAAVLSEAERSHDQVVIKLDDRSRDWLLGRFKKITVSVNSEAELVALHAAAKEAGMLSALIIDSGLTEFNGVPTMTAVAIGPDEPEKIDKLTGKLPLL